MPYAKLRMAICAVVTGLAVAQPVAASDLGLTAACLQQTLLKHHALAYCFGHIAHDDATWRDTRASAGAGAGAYFELGHQGLEACEAIRSLADHWMQQAYVSKPEPGVTPSELHTMRCIDLFHSPALHRLTRRRVQGGSVGKQAP